MSLLKFPVTGTVLLQRLLYQKEKKDVSDIQDKVLSMYAKGMSQRDIADIIEDIYGFEISHETISEITDSVLKRLEEYFNELTFKSAAI